MNPDWQNKARKNPGSMPEPTQKGWKRMQYEGHSNIHSSLSIGQTQDPAPQDWATGDRYWVSNYTGGRVPGTVFSFYTLYTEKSFFKAAILFFFLPIYFLIYFLHLYKLLCYSFQDLPTSYCWYGEHQWRERNEIQSCIHKGNVPKWLSRCNLDLVQNM